jgi:excinuclease ABC subunit C
VASFADKIAQAPETPGVYLLKDARGRVLYVGKARVLRDRLKSYLQPQQGKRLQSLVRRVKDLETIVTRSEVEALVLEENFIKMKKPRFNVRLRDDKKFPYLKLTVKEPFPRIFVTRNITPDGSLFFGPYTRARELRKALRGVKRVFRLRTCKRALPEERRERPCLNFQVKRCLGPCTGDVTEERYRQIADDVVAFLSGRADKLTGELEQRMLRASQAQDYEHAASLRDQLMALRDVSREQQAVVPDRVSWDVIGLARGEGVSVAALLRVREGRVVAKEDYALTAGPDVPDGELLEAALRSVHTHIADIPDEVVLPAEVEDPATFERLFRERRGRKVRIVVPRRGERVGLLRLAAANAEKALVELAPGRRIPHANRELGQLLGLSAPPRVIEGVDISNTQGTNAVGSVVVFEDDQPAKSGYRRFRIRGVQGPNDFAMIEEVLARRLRALVEREQPLPDLVLVDGGKGQLAAAVRAYQGLGTRSPEIPGDSPQRDSPRISSVMSRAKDIPILGLAKRTDTLFYVDGREISLPVRSAALKLLKRIRDESHRFAIAYHRRLRGKRQLESELDLIRGLGPARKKALLQHFGSIERLRLAAVADITKVRGIGPALAETVARRLRG